MFLCVCVRHRDFGVFADSPPRSARPRNEYGTGHHTSGMHYLANGSVAGVGVFALTPASRWAMAALPTSTSTSSSSFFFPSQGSAVFLPFGPGAHGFGRFSHTKVYLACGCTHSTTPVSNFKYTNTQYVGNKSSKSVSLCNNCVFVEVRNVLRAASNHCWCCIVTVSLIPVKA